MNMFRRLFGEKKEGDGIKSPEAPTIEPLTADKPAAETPVAETPAVEKPTAEKPAEIVTAPMVIDHGILYGDGATRPLPEDALIAFLGNAHLTFGQATDVGLMRSNNQDSVHSFFSTSRSSEERPDFGLFLVADGMGGHLDGEKASALTARTVASEVVTTIFIPVLGGDTENQAPITEALT